jgi:hypothetical protein
VKEPGLNPLAAVLIGEGLLPLSCADLLLENGFVVVGVVSSTTGSVRGDERGIAHIEGSETSRVPAPATVRPAVQYRQQPHPGSTGCPSHARRGEYNRPPAVRVNQRSSWAIPEGEDVHGITWHDDLTRRRRGDPGADPTAHRADDTRRA